jgi:hypothetical protein
MERTRTRVPLHWTLTQSNLGNALRQLGERESGTARLEEAVVAYGDALMERTRERVPLDWAESLGNQGVTLMRLAERTKDQTMAETALQQIEAALKTIGGNTPFSAYLGGRLLEVRRIRDALSAR